MAAAEEALVVDEIFVYTGGDVPLGVTRLRVDRSIKIIPDLAFSEKENLVEVHLDEGVEKIGYGVFYNCIRLRRINFPSSLDVIGMLAFAFCLDLADIQFNDGLKIIQEMAFSQCTSLRRMNLPSSLHTMGGNAFNDCTNLEVVAFPAGPGRVGIGYGAFRNCTSLERVVTPLNVHLWSSNHQIFSGCTNLVTVELIGGVYELVFSLCIEQWRRNEIMREILRINRVLPTTRGDRKTTKLHEWSDSVHYTMERYKLEHNRLLLMEVSTSIELVLWKIKLDEECIPTRSKRKRSQCRVNCGATIVLKNVLPFLTLFK